MWLAGGGFKAGYVHGLTDELGFNVVQDPVHVHDLNATLLHQLGFDHTRLTFRFQGARLSFDRRPRQRRDPAVGGMRPLRILKHLASGIPTAAGFLPPVDQRRNPRAAPVLYSEWRRPGNRLYDLCDSPHVGQVQERRSPRRSLLAHAAHPIMRASQPPP